MDRINVAEKSDVPIQGDWSGDSETPKDLLDPFKDQMTMATYD